MSFLESIVVSIFSLSLVFLVLAILSGMVKIISLLLGFKKSSREETQKAAVPAEPDKHDWDTKTVNASSGELRLEKVDEKTAAIIMAIVSDESKIPLSELYFKSITAVE